MSPFKPTICIDFDGVLHSYSSGWKGVSMIVDPPVAGAIAWLKACIADPNLDPVIYSSRSKEEAGVEAMMNWLLIHGLTTDEVLALDFPTQKPAAFLTIDDRAICFEGTFPSGDEMRAFTPWNKR